MANVLTEIGTVCDGVDQPNNFGGKKCDINLNNWFSSGFLATDGADFINTDGLSPLADNAALKAKIETEATFTGALSLAGDNRLSFISEINETEIPENINSEIDRANGSKGQSNIHKDRTLTLKWNAPSSELHEHLFQFSGGSRKFFIVLPDGRFVFKRLSDAEVAAGESPFFDATQIRVSEREGTTGDTNEDMVKMMITHVFGELVKFSVYNTQGFGKRLVLNPVA